MTDLNAGDRIVASGLKHPFFVSAAANSNLTVTTATVTDIPGATVTFSTVQATAGVIVWGVFDIAVLGTALGVAVGFARSTGRSRRRWRMRSW